MVRVDIWRHEACYYIYLDALYIFSLHFVEVKKLYKRGYQLIILEYLCPAIWIHMIVESLVIIPEIEYFLSGQIKERFTDKDHYIVIVHSLQLHSFCTNAAMGHN